MVPTEDLEIGGLRLLEGDNSLAYSTALLSQKYNPIVALFDFGCFGFFGDFLDLLVKLEDLLLILLGLYHHRLQCFI